MKKILFIIIFCSLFSGSAFAKKRVCIGVLKDYLNPLSKTPIILAKRNMLMEVVDCYEGNTWNQRYLYDVYGFYKKDEIFKILYPIITKDGINGWDKWTLDKFEIILGEEHDPSCISLNAADPSFNFLYSIQSKLPISWLFKIFNVFSKSLFV